jgi:RNA polymerase sigma-70 factor (ECF subfamily)
MQLPLNERELVERAQHGDKEAVSALYESYVHTIFQYISYRVESDAVAEDLVADVFLRMVRGLPDYQYTGAPLGAWLFRIAANRITDHYRTHRRTATVPLPEDYGSSLGNPFDELMEEEERSRLRTALQALSEDYQNVLILRFMRDLPYAEVADIMDRSEGAVRVMQHRALKSLAAELTKFDNSDYGRREDEHA